VNVLQSIFSLLNDIFVQSPGDFLYFLVVMVLNLVSLMMAFRLGKNGEAALRRYPLALSGVVFAWSLMFAGAIFIQFSGQAPTAILPPLERAVTVATMLLLGWAFMTSDDQRWRDVSNNLLLLLLLTLTIAYTITGILWVDLAANIDFNLTNYGLFWAFTLLGIPIFGILLVALTLRSVIDAPLKLVYFLIIALGGGLTFYQMMSSGLTGDDLGIFRLCFTLAQVIIPMVVYRSIVNSYENELLMARARPITKPMPLVKSHTSPSEPARISEQDALNAQLLKALGTMLETADPKDIPRRIIITMLDTLRADVGVLLRLQDANYADITVAQDRLMARKLVGMSLNLDNQPTLVNAIERHGQRGIYPDRNKIELDDLFTRLDIDQTGPVYFQPLVHANEVFAVVMIALPYTKRELRHEELELLKGLGIVSGNLLALSYKADEVASLAEDRIIQAMVDGVPPSDIQESEVLQARLEMQENLKAARQQISNLTHQVVELSTQLEHEQTRLIRMMGDSEEGLSVSQQIRAINEEQEDLREERDQLTKRLQEAETALQGAVASDNESVVNNLVDALKREKDVLEAEKIRLQSQLDELRTQNKAVVVPSDLQSLLNRMMAEKVRLEDERNQLNTKLGDIQAQLQEMGIEDDITGLSQLISQLYEERASFKEQNRLLQQERDALLHEREHLVDHIDQEKDRNNRIRALEDKIENLASDREIAVKLSEKLRKEQDEVQGKLNAVKEHRARLLAQATGYEIELREARDEQMQLRAQIQELADIRSALIHNRDQLAAENHALNAELRQLQNQARGDSEPTQTGKHEGIEALQVMVQELSQQRDELERELNQSRTYLAEIENELTVARTTLVKNNSDATSYKPNNPELLVGLVQELRTPMTSISGYIDLLLAESAGILGEKQRKFLQRVAANISRLSIMIEGLIKVTHLDTGNFRLEPRPINIIHLVEEAITNASIQFREKGLAVTMDLDDTMPNIPVDEDAIRQVIGQLLSNAYLISPPNSDIQITVTRRPVRLSENERPRPSLYLAIQDSGGGIHPEDIPRVFARQYKAENPLIEGLGDTGVGMSIAKTLIEAHKGKLWVEAQTGMGSTFAFAIPLDTES
jgi:signal transduction histidine kinase